MVSVITVVFNGVEHLQQAITAVALQTYPNIQHIIIDGASTDGTIAAYATTRLMASLLFGVSPGDPLTYVAGAALLVSAAGAASYVPVRRTTGGDPAVTLRAE